MSVAIGRMDGKKTHKDKQCQTANSEPQGAQPARNEVGQGSQQRQHSSQYPRGMIEVGRLDDGFVVGSVLESIAIARQQTGLDADDACYQYGHKRQQLSPALATSSMMMEQTAKSKATAPAIQKRSRASRVVQMVRLVADRWLASPWSMKRKRVKRK